MRFRVNPVESVIFVLMLSIFGHSVYQLVNAGAGFEPGGGTSPMIVNYRSDALRGRIPASSQSAFQDLKVDCAENQNISTSAERVRIITSHCVAEEGPALKELKVSYGAGSQTPTLFPSQDAKEKLISTEFLPLVKGQNSIKMTYFYQDGTSFQRVVTILK